MEMYSNRDWLDQRLLQESSSAIDFNDKRDDLQQHPWTLLSLVWHLWPLHCMLSKGVMIFRLFVCSNIYSWKIEFCLRSESVGKKSRTTNSLVMTRRSTVMTSCKILRMMTQHVKRQARRYFRKGSCYPHRKDVLKDSREKIVSQFPSQVISTSEASQRDRMSHDMHLFSLLHFMPSCPDVCHLTRVFLYQFHWRQELTTRRMYEKKDTTFARKRPKH